MALKCKEPGRRPELAAVDRESNYRAGTPGVFTGVVPDAFGADGTAVPAGDGTPVPPGVSVVVAEPMLDAVPLAEGTAVAAPGVTRVEASPLPAPVLRITPPASGAIPTAPTPVVGDGKAGPAGARVVGAFPNCNPLGESAVGAGKAGATTTGAATPGVTVVTGVVVTVVAGATGSGSVFTASGATTFGAGVAFALGRTFSLAMAYGVINTRESAATSAHDS